MKKIRIASFFSGCGGMDLGAIGGFNYLDKRYKKNKVEIIYSMDFDAKVCNLYNLNFKHKIIYQDIRKIKVNDIPDHDILTGGFPCQSFSISAQNPKRLGYKDEKGQLFFELCKILSVKSPRFFIAENVKGILSANKKEAFPLIIKNFEECGYHVKYKLINSSHFGVPQKRERVFIIGFKYKIDYDKFEFPKEVSLSNPIPLKYALEEEIDKKFFFSEKAVLGMKKSKNSIIMNKGRHQNFELPCNTVTSHLAKVSLNSTDPVLKVGERYRMFTPREVARIQSFPDNYLLLESNRTNYIGLGNAVPPVVMWYITKSLLKVFKNENLE